MHKYHQSTYEKSSIPHGRLVFMGKKYKCRSLSTYTVREMFAIEIPVSVVNIKEYSKNRKDISNAGKFDRFRIFLEVERFMRANLTSKLYDAEYLSWWLIIVARKWYTDDSRNNIILLFEWFDQQAHLTRYQVDKAEALYLHLTSDFHVFAFRLLFLNVCFFLLSFFFFVPFFFEDTTFHRTCLPILPFNENAKSRRLRNEWASSRKKKFAYRKVRLRKIRRLDGLWNSKHAIKYRV